MKQKASSAISFHQNKKACESSNSILISNVPRSKAAQGNTPT